MRLMSVRGLGRRNLSAGSILQRLIKNTCISTSSRVAAFHAFLMLCVSTTTHTKFSFSDSLLLLCQSVSHGLGIS